MLASIEMLPQLEIGDAFRYSLLAFGLAYVITCSTIGVLIRVPWCFLLKWTRWTRFFWNTVTCPSCNAWWGGLVIASLSGEPLLLAIQYAFVACGLTAVIRQLTGLTPPEDMEEILGVKHAETGK